MIDPAQYMIKLQGREYLPVAPRVVMFREAHPEWAIVTELVDNGGKGLVKAYIQDATGNVVATAHKTVVSFKGGDVEKAETGAIGRALSLAGFGTIAAQDLDEGEQIADAPVERNGGTPANADGVRDMVRLAIEAGDRDALDDIRKRVDALHGPHRANAQPYYAVAMGVLGDVEALAMPALEWGSKQASRLIGKDGWDAHASKAVTAFDATIDALKARAT